MAPRRKRKPQKQNPFFNLILPAAFLLALIPAIQYNLTGYIDFPRFEFLSPLFTLVGLLIGLGIVVLIVVKVVRFYSEKFHRDYLVRRQRHLHDWFSMDPETFEHFVAGVYEKQGYKVIEVTSYQADHGIDVVLEKNKKRYAVQVKQYRDSVIGEKEVREFYGSYVSKFDGGTFLTTSSFTRPAKNWAKEVGMLLVDGDYLIKMVDS